jgi:D-glycero-D-manno-heptose 1,7-bisphosphate phosphatase
MTNPATYVKSLWSLFLDRDGVINERLPGDYIKAVAQFRFIPGVQDALARLKELFSPIVIVSNQQGIGRGLMTDTDLSIVHRYMLDEITNTGGCIDTVYYCPALADENHPDRKPNTGMALRAKEDYPQIEFTRSLMIGDSETDMVFGKKLGMKTVFITGKRSVEESKEDLADMKFDSLYDFANWIDKNISLFI